MCVQEIIYSVHLNGPAGNQVHESTQLSFPQKPNLSYPITYRWTALAFPTNCRFLSHAFILALPGVALSTMNKLNFITGNKNKLAEVRAILGSVINVENQAVDVPEIQGSIEDIAKEKSRRAAEVVRNRQTLA